MAVTVNQMAEAYIQSVQQQLQAAQEQAQQAQQTAQQANDIVLQIQAHLNECVQQLQGDQPQAIEAVTEEGNTVRVNEDGTTTETIPVNPFQSISQE